MSNCLSHPATPPVPPGSTAHRQLLAAVRDALDCPPAALTDRARLVLATVRHVLGDHEDDPDDLMAAAGSLRDLLADFPTDHSPARPA
jgi:hypothetical protein